MQVSLLKDTLLSQVSNGATAGTSAVTTSVVDMGTSPGFDAALFVASLGTVTSTCVLTLTVYENATNSNSGGSAVSSGSCTITDSGGATSNTLLAVDVLRPTKRYLYATLTRTTANAVVNDITCQQYRAKSVPVTQGSTVSASAVSSSEV